MSEHPGGRFCSKIQKYEGGRLLLDCFIRFGDATSGSVLSKVVDGVPPYPLQSAEQTRDIAVQLADVEGFAANEIIWEGT
jgi:hypothetical protein